MKTTKKIVAPATEISLNELIFENRNHAYGAYELRKRYDKRLLIGLFFAFFIFTSAISIQVIENYMKDDVFVIVPPVDNRLVEFEDLDTDIPLPPPPVETLPPAAIRQLEVFVPIIVDTISPDYLSTVVDEVIEVDNNEVLPPVYAIVDETDDGGGLIDPESQNTYWSVQEPAMFNGGSLDKFREWVVKNITYPQDAVESEINGRVQIIFGVNSKGNVCNVTLRRGVHPSLDDEVIRTILNSPSWLPARQNGTAVKQMFSLIVSFRRS